MPSNVLPLFFLALGSLALGLRGIMRYRSLKSPLIMYYSLAAILIGAAALVYSLPFTFFDDSRSLKIAITIGDVLYYVGILMVVKIIWYLRLKQRKVPFLIVAVPVGLVAGFSFLIDLFYRQDQIYGVFNNVATYPTSPVALSLLALLSSSIIICGFLTITEGVKINDKRQRWRLFSIGTMMLLGGIVAVNNFLFLQGTNNNTASLVGYAMVFWLFLSGLLFVRKSKH